jgi:RNA polymerase sigma factor (sigma-70 family)
VTSGGVGAPATALYPPASLREDGARRTMDERTPDVLERIRQGDGAAYKVLFQRYREPLRSFLRAHTDPAFVRVMSLDDLVQEVHLAALRALGRFSYRRERSFYFWLCEIARRSIASHCRNLKRHPPALGRPLRLGSPDATSSDVLAAVGRQAPTPLDQVCLRENLHLLAIAMSHLHEKRRRAIVLRYVEGHESEHAAALMDTTPGAFRVLLHRALEDLRAAFGEAPEEGTGAPP